MRAFRALLLGLICSFFALSQPAQAQEKRIALLIGNQQYSAEVGPLKNPHNDVAHMAAALKEVGFEVTIVKDAGFARVHREINAYVRRLSAAGPDTIGFLYYAGHGAQQKENKENYLIPVDVQSVDADLWDGSVRLKAIVDQLKEQAANATHFVVFDACRNTLRLVEPGSRAIVQARGFEPVRVAPGMLIAFATAEGETASDVGEGVGPYARALADELIKPGVEAVAMFRKVQLRVRDAIGQEPWLSQGALKEVYFRKQPAAPDTSAVTTAVVPPTRAPEVECDRLAAHPEDPQAVTSGVPFDRIDTQRAVRACDVARSQYPGEQRFVFQLARAHSAAKDYARQKELLEGLVRDGYVAAYMALGIMYSNGQGVPEDKTHGTKLYRQGAEKGHHQAMLALGEGLLRSTQEVERDEGFKWVRRVAEAGNVRIMLELGRALLASEDAGRQNEGVTWIEKAANAANGDAMAIFGRLYRQGGILAQDMAKAMHWIERGADAGSAFAMETLGRALVHGTGIAKDEWKASEWLRKAANAGRPGAMVQLGRLYWYGMGVPKDRSEAFRRYREAAEIAINTNDTEPLCTIAQINLGGKAVTKDLAEAAKWFAKAAEGGCTVSMVSLGVMHLEGAGGLQKDEAKAEAWFRRASEIAPAALGCPFADAYLRGKVPPNLVQTVNWFTKAAEAGCPFSMYSVGVILAEGRGLPKDDAKALAWFGKANAGLQEELDDGDGDTAAAMLADMHRHGRGVPKNDAEALRLARLSAERDHPVGMTLVGEMYELGRGTAKSEREAATWYRKASDIGAELAMLHLGRLYAEGRGVAKSEAEARDLFRRAAKSDFVEHVWRGAVSVIGNPEFNLLRQPYQTATLMLLALAEEPRYRERLVADAAKVPQPVRIALQARLKSTGHYKGPVNGTLGPTTRAALEAWASSRRGG